MRRGFGSVWWRRSIAWLTLAGLAVLAGGGWAEPASSWALAPGVARAVLAQDSGGTVASDRAALMALYDEADGANWKVNTNWGSEEPLGWWYGVGTDADGRVTELTLGGNNLRGTLPAELGGLASLKLLRLYGGELNGPIPAALGSLANLEALWLFGNELSGRIPAALGVLTSLREMSLASNKLSGPIPAELGSLVDLRVLVLGSNELSGAIPPELGNLANLEHLDLADSELSGAIPAELGNLTKLRSLYLWDNQLSGPIPASLGNLADLEQLDVRRNELSGPIPGTLGNLADLRSLYLQGNQLSGIIPASLGNLASLEYLDLTGNELRGAIPAELGELADLRGVSLAINQLSGPIPATLGSLPKLRGLHLRNNELRGAIPPALGNLTNLEILSLSTNELSGAIPPALGDLANLRGLFLHQNQLSGAIPPELGDLPNLRNLSLQSNQLSGAITPELGNLSNVRELHLDNNQLTGPIPAELGRLASVQFMHFAGNALSGCVPDTVRRLLTDPPPGQFGPSHDVALLGLPFCMLRGLHLEGATLEPPFASSTSTYTASVDSGIVETAVRVTLYRADDAVIVRAGRQNYANGAAVPLNEGANAITIQIKPTDYSPPQVVSVVVTRASTDPNTVSLHADWNVVVWDGADGAGVLDALGSDVAAQVDVLYRWVAETQTWTSFRPGGPAFLDGFDTFERGASYWVRASESVEWTVVGGPLEPPAAEAIRLYPGWNQIVWRGADGAGIAEALRPDVFAQVASVFHWVAETQTWTSYRPGAPAFLNGFDTLASGASYWISVAEEVEWAVPP